MGPIVKRKDKGNHLTPVKRKKARQEKTGDFSDDEDLSDIDGDGEVFNGVRIPAALPPIVSAEDNPGPRMVIRKIVASNFKSYYGEVTIGPFHQSLSCIVGANGSGKSNVIDSLLFVFGYRSSKIRSKKVSVLIHKSDKHKDIQQCSVTVHFMHIQDDSTQEKGFVEIPHSEITIMRTAHKDNTSFYTLNNKRVKFKDVAIILKKNGIDLIHNRFLILQGEVEQIAMMKPKAENEHSTGMLEYLEDVIGTVRYKKPIAQLEEKLNELSLEKNEKFCRLKAVLTERDQLYEPVLEVVKIIKLENQLARIDSKKNQKEIYEINKLIDYVTEDQIRHSEQISLIESELKEIAESKKEKDKLLQELDINLKTDKKKHDSLEKKSKNILQEENNLKASIDHTNDHLKKLENSIKQEQKKITKAQGLPTIKEAELETLKLQLAPLVEECAKLEANHSKINSNGFEKSKEYREEKDALAPEESKLLKLVASKQNQLQSLKTEFEVLIDTEKSEKKKLTDLEKELSEGVNEFNENLRRKEKAEIDVRSSKDSIQELEIKVKQLKDDEIKTRKNLHNIRQSLSEKRTAYAETTERSRPIKYILSLKDKKEIGGVLGRCGDFGQVEGKFDVPASTACGSTDQIVVESQEAGFACIEKLRTNNIGRLTFSILPKIQHLKPRADAINNYPKNSKRVFDLIKILDQRFRLTFYSGLYDTLLAENLDHARQIAYDQTTRYRVVTYKGEIIEQSGVMSGGGRPVKGKIGPQETKVGFAGANTSLVSQNDVEKLDKFAKDLELKLRNTETNIFDVERSIMQHCGRIEELNMIIKLCMKRIKSWKEKENKLKNLIENQKLVIIENKTDPVAVNNKKADIKKAEKELEKAEVEHDKIKLKMDCLNKKIEEITVGEPKQAKRLLEEAVAKLEKTRNDIIQVNIDIQGATRQIQKSEDNIISMNKDIYINKENIKSLNEKKMHNDVVLKELSEQITELNSVINEKEEKIQSIQSKEDENHKRTSELRKKKITLSQSLEAINKEIEKFTEQRKQHQQILSKLKLQKLPKVDCVQRDPYIEAHDFNENSTTNTTPVPMEKNHEEQNPEVNVKLQDTNSNELEVNDVDSDENDDQFFQYTKEQLEKLVAADIHCHRVLVQEEINNRNPNFKLVEEYHKKCKQYHTKADELSAVLRLYIRNNEMINLVRQRRRDEFMASFKKITIKLKEMYQMITLGGDAELELVDSLDPFSEGVNFSVRPPKKTWKVISNLSGGEKTLSSLALVFALHYYKPSPLYVMDEIDAALDFKNVSIIGHYIKERTKNSQFIIISLRSNMFEKANYLVGIYKTNDCTRTTYVDVNEYTKVVESCLIKHNEDQATCSFSK